MALTDLKRAKPPKEKASDKGQPATIGPSYEERPYCLRFTLEGPELEKLGLSPSNFAGMEPMTATVKLDPITIRDITNKTTDKWEEKRNQSVEFQILAIEFGSMKAKEKSKFSSYDEQKNRGPG